MAASWLDFFDGEHPIYVNDRHRLLHDRMVAGDVAALVPGPAAVVLDFGCGEATEAATVAARCARLYLSDAAPHLRERVAARHAGNPRIAVLSPDDVEALPESSLDLVVMNSILQYLSRQELMDWLQVFRSKLRPGGRVLLGDVIPPDVSPLTDAVALLRFGFEGGFFVAALGGLVRTFFSDYRKLRSDLGLTTYPEAEILAIVDQAGYEARRHRPNIGHNQSRMTIVGTVPDTTPGNAE